MTTLIIVSKRLKSSEGYHVQNLVVKSLDMDEIAKQFPKQIDWATNSIDCEIFMKTTGKGGWIWIARRNGRGWTEINTRVKNWERYASPSYVRNMRR